MVSIIPQLVAAIRPDIFCQPKARAAVKKILRKSLAAGDRLAYLNAAERAEPFEPNLIPLDQLLDMDLFELTAQHSPVEKHKLILEHLDDALEPLYFGLLDELEHREGWRVTKLVDTVTGTSGAGLSADLTRRTMQQQEQAAKLMVRIHNQVRALMQLWQKWCEEKQRLKIYDEARGSSKGEAALRILQNRWRRKSDLDSSSPENSNTGADFEAWREQSEFELRQRLEIDRQLLASELHFLKLQAGWLKPYLHSMQKPQAGGDPALVNAFNTALFELVLLVEPPSEIELAVQNGELPKMLLGKRHRQPRPLLVVELKIRAVPERTQAGSYVYRGRAEITFTSYALNEDELAVLRREMERNEFGELFGTVEQQTPETLHHLLSDLDELFAESDPQRVKQKSATEDINPFAALFSIIEWFKPSSAEADRSIIREPLRPDSDAEQLLRSFMLLEARSCCRDLYEDEKRRRQMPVEKR